MFYGNEDTIESIAERYPKKLFHFPINKNISIKGKALSFLL